MMLNALVRIIGSGLKIYSFAFYTVFVTFIIYFSFYLCYLPSSEHCMDIFFNYRTICNADRNVCSFPTASVNLHSSPQAAKEGYRVLTRGQGYNIILELDLPLSDVNRNLGMFMVQVDFLSKEQQIIFSQSRSALLRYESRLLRIFKTILYILPLVTGLKAEQEKMSILLVENFVDDSYHPIMSVNITIHSKQIQIYSAKLHFKADFTGLRYYMHHWPFTFSVFGFLTIFGFVVFYFIYRFIRHVGSTSSSYIDYTDLSEESGDEEDVVDGSKDEFEEQVENLNAGGPSVSNEESELRRRTMEGVSIIG